MKTETADINGAAVRFAAWGHGPRTLVIIPGVSLTRVTDAAAAVEARYRVFAKTHTIILADRREAIPEGFSVERMADDEAALMDAMGVRDADIFGASQGGTMAILLAARRPDLVRRLAVCSAPVRTMPGLRRAASLWTGMAEAGDSRGLAKAFCDSIYSPPLAAKYRKYLDGLDIEYPPELVTRFVRQLDACLDIDITREARAVRCPTLVTGSEGDSIIGAEGPAETAKATGGSLHIYGREYGHAVYDEAEDFTDRLRCFFG